MPRLDSHNKIYKIQTTGHNIACINVFIFNNNYSNNTYDGNSSTYMTLLYSWISWIGQWRLGMGTWRAAVDNRIRSLPGQTWMWSLSFLGITKNSSLTIHFPGIPRNAWWHFWGFPRRGITILRWWPFFHFSPTAALSYSGKQEGTLGILCPHKVTEFHNLKFNL